MANVVLTNPVLKGSYIKYDAQGINGPVYFSKAAFDGDAPATFAIDVPGAAPVKAGKSADPAALQAAAEKAAARAAKAATRAAAAQAAFEKYTAAAAANTAAAAAAVPGNGGGQLVGKGGHKGARK